MLSKFGKEKKLYQTQNFRVKYGTVDASKMTAIYVIVESWIQPLEITNFDSCVRLTRKKIINQLKNNIKNTIFLDNFIVDLDLRSSGMSINKKSFMSIEITVYPNKLLKFNSDIIKNQISEITDCVIKEVQKNNFKFNAKK